MGQKNFKLLVAALLVAVFALGFFSVIGTTCAQSSYEWLMNEGFEDCAGTELINNGDLESGDFTDGWSVASGSPSVSAVHSLSVTHSLFMGVAGSSVWYNFSVPVEVANIASFTFNEYETNHNGTLNQKMVLYYSDGTDSGDIEINPSTQLRDIWNLKDVTVLTTLSEGKSISAFKLAQLDSNCRCYYDDFSMRSYVLGQDSITPRSSPWFSVFYADNQESSIAQALVLNGLWTHSGVWALKYKVWDFYGFPYFAQNVNFLSVDRVSELSIWVKSSSSLTNVMYCKVFYSDGSVGSMSQNFVSFNQWQKLTFTEMLSSGKLIVRVMFQIQNSLGGAWNNDVFIDDVSLLADVPVSTKFFEFSLSPAPYSYNNIPDNLGGYIENQYGYGFSQYYGIRETFFGKVYDSSGSLAENGTFSVSMDVTTTSGTVTNGEFNFEILARSGVVARSESFTITVSLTAPAPRSFIVTIVGQWFVYTVVTPTPSGVIDDGTGGFVSDTFLNMIVSFGVTCAVTLIPAWILGVLCKGGAFGWIGGMVVGAGAGYFFFPAYVPLWLVFVMVLFTGAYAWRVMGGIHD